MLLQLVLRLVGEVVDVVRRVADAAAHDGLEVCCRDVDVAVDLFVPRADVDPHHLEVGKRGVAPSPRRVQVP